MGREGEDAAARDSTGDDPADEGGEQGDPDADGGGEDAHPDERIGGGFFEEELGPGSAMAPLYRGAVHRMTR